MIAPTLVLLLLLTGPPAPEELAALRIDTQPGAEVIWEGVSLGSTGADGLLVVEQIPPGRFSIELRKEGYHPLSVEIEVVADRVNEFELQLTPIQPPPPAAARAAPPPAPTPAPIKTEPPPEPTPTTSNPEPTPPPAPGAEEPRASRPAGVGTGRAAAGSEGKAAQAASTAVQTSAAGADSAVAQETRARVRWPWFLALAMVLAASLYVVGRFRANFFYRDWDDFSSEVALEVEKTLRPPPPPPASWERPSEEEEKIVSGREEGPEFIEELKRREKDLDLDDPRVRRRAELEFIDARFVEVGEVESEK